MKQISALFTAIGVMGVFLLVAAFMNLRGEKTISKLNKKENHKGFAVVELFTSEGCSSCPPADELIEKIQHNENKEIYILAFHVDYWDHQGWKDKFSQKEYSERQRKYASVLNLKTIYTPQIIINGTTECVGSDQGAVLTAISNSLDQPSAAAESLTLSGKIEAGKLNIEYQLASADRKSELILALVQKSAKSSVKAGENSGRNLSHVQIVRQLLHTDVDSKESVMMNLPEDFKAKGWELIGFVQHKTDGHIVSAARFDVEPELTLRK